MFVIIVSVAGLLGFYFFSYGVAFVLGMILKGPELSGSIIPRFELAKERYMESVLVPGAWGQVIILRKEISDMAMPGVPPVWDLFLKEISVIVSMDMKP